ncbi:hypothetical protein PR202_gb16371 [Eleusine coracana subsp. coracana]|uniref:Uncharacterized protein n=1 Tax=Eleusine coracana subsp. coracana TaxID=191504 RepID=A0AAV5F0B0_ELECO|nr:hypothetical protein PR202_gb16371 [Eleusine coracana subsp. coracana]
MKSTNNSSGVCLSKSCKNISGVCPVTGKNNGAEHQSNTGNAEQTKTDPRMVPAKCPHLAMTPTHSSWVPACFTLLHFKDCPLCGADIEGIEPDSQLQPIVDRFIHVHAQIKRSHAVGNAEVLAGNGKVIYEDGSMERGAFLVQPSYEGDALNFDIYRLSALRTLKAQSLSLTMCAEDIRDELKSSEDNLPAFSAWTCIRDAW